MGNDRGITRGSMGAVRDLADFFRISRPGDTHATYRAIRCRVTFSRWTPELQQCRVLQDLLLWDSLSVGNAARIAFWHGPGKLVRI